MPGISLFSEIAGLLDIRAIVDLDQTFGFSSATRFFILFLSWVGMSHGVILQILQKLYASCKNECLLIISTGGFIMLKKFF